MIKVNMIFVFLLRATFEACGHGCLKCDRTNNCTICDFSNNYYISNGSCVLLENPDCLVFNSSGDCQQCKKEFFLDTSTKKCAPTNILKVVQNCLKYDSNQSCLTCDKNYFVSNGKCAPVLITVDHCESYSRDGKCSLCSSGYIFNNFRDRCVQSPNISNCASYSYVACNACAAGYVLTRNIDLTRYKSNDQMVILDFKNFVDNYFNDKIVPTQCLKISHMCALTDWSGQCSLCNHGYYLDSNRNCRTNPKPRIEACQIYSSLTSCSACLQGYVLKSPTNCTIISQNELINNCISYNTSASTVECLQCVDIKYLTNNMCLYTRVDSMNIANCKIRAIKDDTCAICDKGFILTSDAKKCSIAQPNCVEYKHSDITTKALSCKKCANGFYLELKESVSYCIKGFIEGCISYSSNNICTACDNSGYYLQDFRCLKHVPIQNCVKYHELNFNECRVCELGYYPFKLLTKCSMISVIPNCISYYDEFNCQKCAEGFFLRENKCLSISDSFPNCKIVSEHGNHCKKCTHGYFLHLSLDRNTCEPIYNYIRDQCDTLNDGVVNKSNSERHSNFCLKCKENSFPIELGNMFSCIEDNLIHTKGVLSPVNGCRQYNNDEVPLCLQCNKYLYIPGSGNRTCVDSCDPIYDTMVDDNLDGHIKTCANNSADGPFSIQGCVHAIKILDNRILKLSCLKYRSGKATINLSYGLQDNPSFWKDIDDSTIPKVEGSFLYYGFPIFSSLNSDNNAHDTEREKEKDCEIYWNTGGTLYCYRCKWGYASKYFIADNSNPKTQCQLIDGCNTNITYSGFSAQLNRILTCHVCNHGEFVTVFLGSDEDDAELNITGLVREKMALRCLPLSIFETETSPLAVDGCLIYGWIYQITDPTLPKNPVRSKGCLGCQPGYKLDKNFGTCREIIYCDKLKGNMANRCSFCTQTSPFGSIEYKAFKDYKAESCHLVKTDNCLYADSVADVSHQYNCKVCRPGYWLNHDKICEKIMLPKYSGSVSSVNFYTISEFDSFDTIGEYYAVKQISKSNSLNGCDLCDSGFTAFKMAPRERQCVFSPYIQETMHVPFYLTRYIHGCAKYNNKLNKDYPQVGFCSECRNNKIPTDNGSHCFNKLPNCRVLLNLNTSKCSLCMNTHVLISGVCVLKNIDKCKTYDESRGVLEISCIKCAKGFVLSSNKKHCYLGNIIGCEKYYSDSPWTCNKCMKGYDLISTANSGTYCLKIGTETNCLSLQINSNKGVQGGFYTCSKCFSNNTFATMPQDYDIDNSELAQSICLPLNSVDKCVAYESFSQKVKNNSFLCIACEAGYYIDESKNKCQARKHRPLGCVSYYENEDKCRICNSTSFKNEGETDCFEFPSGIPMCDAYESEEICSKCVAPAYVVNNTCVLSSPIDNCEFYISNYTCDQCVNGYFLQNSTSCIKAQANNCFAYSDINTCSKCDPFDKKKGLKTDENGVTHCVDKNIVNCNKSTDRFPFKCTECSAGYYLTEDGNCLSPPANILNCLFYSDSMTCLVCKQGYILSVDHKSCSNTFPLEVDKNCVDNQKVDVAVCSKCNPGYYFVNDACTSCASTSESNGCFLCDPSDVSDCLVCKPGYYQHANGKCISTHNIVSGIIRSSDSFTINCHLLHFLILLAFSIWD